MTQVINGIARGISTYCGCQYPSEYIKQWNVKCRQGSDNNADVIVTAQLMPTNMYSAALLMDSMSTWIRDTAVPTVNIDGSEIRVDKDCKVQMDHPYGTDCVVYTLGKYILTKTIIMKLNNNYCKLLYNN